MPKYRVELTDGRVFDVEADAPPSEQDVLSALGNAPSKATTEPAALDDPFGDARAGKFITENLPTIAGSVAGLATGGLGAIPAIGLTAAAGAGGGALRNLLTGKGTASDALTAGAQEGVIEGAGRGVGGALKLVARGAYRAGALPLTQMFGKYGDLITKGLESGVPATKKGLIKAEDLRNAASARKRAAVDASDESVQYLPNQIHDSVLQKVAPNADLDRRLGRGADPLKDVEARGKQFLDANPKGTLTPKTAETLKGRLDDTTGGAHQKLRKREALTRDEEFDMALSRELGDAQAAAIPGYREMNREVMDAEGVRRMIARRLQGNQGLENALTMAVGPAAIPARLLMLPGVATHAGIAADRASQYAAPTSAQMIRAAMLTLLGQHDEP